MVVLNFLAKMGDNMQNIANQGNLPEPWYSEFLLGLRHVTNVGVGPSCCRPQPPGLQRLD